MVNSNTSEGEVEEFLDEELIECRREHKEKEGKKDNSTLHWWHSKNLTPTHHNGHHQEVVKPGDQILIRAIKRKSWSSARWEGPFMVQLTTPTAVKV
ncbi:uncharacterized protein LOC144181120 [Stigmatopora nigra]